MKRPNILFILLDDMGWKDLACTGSTFYETPNIDRLAREGMSFANAYASCPVCSPSRASFLTGKYPARLQLTDWTEAALHDAVMAVIPDSGMKNGQVLWPLRIAITGRESTPGWG